MSCVPDRIAPTILGTMNGFDFSPATWRRFRTISILVLGAFGVAVSSYGIHALLKKSTKKTKQIPLEENIKVQGNTTSEDQLKKEASRNVWYDSNVQLTSFDVPSGSVGLNLTDSEARDFFGKNVVRLEFVTTREDGTINRRRGNAVFVRGPYVLVNKHTLDTDSDEWSVTVTVNSVAQGINSNVVFSLHRSEIAFLENTDLMMFKITCIPPKRDITRFWNSGVSSHSRVLEILREIDGTCVSRVVYGASAQMSLIPELQITTMVCSGKSDGVSKHGDCGSLCVSMTPRGPIVYGIHLLGMDNWCGMMQVTLSQVEQLIVQIDTQTLVPVCVQGGELPQLGAPGVQQPLGPVHYKSLTRYVPQGKVNVYGTFQGFRAQPISKVSNTCASAEMCEHFSTQPDHGKPSMKGWAPWRRNLMDMVDPICSYDRTIIQECVEAYTNDIIVGLPQGWKDQLVFLSDEAAVNGLPGVRFIDGLNKSSSMGFPWCTTKKAYLTSAPSDKYPEGVTFGPDIWSRVEAIKSLYKEGKRACPVFSANLKDTPTPFDKIAINKTRVFTGAPVDWSIVVRSRLLSFVKLLQENKFVFEAGPGTVCQSEEWGQIREYLVAFGEDRIVAGDYGSFDKKMAADFILAAYQIIAAVHKEAGFSEEDVREIMAIGADTAYSFCNFNGDLMEFFGTNPSGHPLTVIVNSLVNGLYMRYCYKSLNPESIVTTFKEHVHLFTYGDDNIMGVSKCAPWFNHTAIQAVLADIGVKYTMADKHSESRPFVSLDEVSFLKRIWRYDDDVQAYLCPLDEKSIQRSLITWLPSSTVDCYTQMVAVVIAANNEFFFYGKKRFEKEHQFFKEFLSQSPYCNMPDACRLPSWEDLYDRFYRRTATPLSEGSSTRDECALDLAIQCEVN